MSYIKECKEQTVYLIGGDVDSGLKIEESNYYDHVMKSVDETTTPKGVAPRYFVEEEEIKFWREDVLEDNEFSLEREDFESQEDFEESILWNHVENLSIYLNGTIGDVKFNQFEFNGSNGLYWFTYYVISSWGTGGNNYKNGKNDWTNCFETEEQAEDELFERIVEYDFKNDCSRDTTYFYYKDEVEDAIVERYKYAWNVDEEVVKSILNKQKKLEELSLKKKQQHYNIERKEYELAQEYAKLIQPKEEKFKQTMKRLSDEIDGKLNKRLFITAVKIIRSKIK